ncbi:tRNA pseudouridine synthase B [Babesia sp. Xinjiang]|uniref:tRNA pseudouridine synthase B n=1 Tax=Babesia sp. Xinjiang TaxID=462227 RepID=UPI000A254F48|nr:tRNA pseudouridine synthase B [Babesia sp. Xinjiang]ORM40086.1 tRNA pseudouridine synthase B [Babesia sp. Xinjiang]
MTVAQLLQCLSIIAFNVVIGFTQRSQTSQRQPFNGILNIYKPRGITSNDTCQLVKKILTEGYRERYLRSNIPKIKVGHGGTLDMHAEGVLAVGVGGGTKALSFYLKGDKTYEATGVLGHETDTLDINGKTLREAPWEHITDAAFEEAVDSMNGVYEQIPPLYSSKKYRGKTLREYAIKNLPVEVKSAQVMVHRIERLRVPGLELPHFGLRVACSGGTYVRSLIRDIAYKLGTLGTMKSLVRTVKCNLNVADSLNVSSLDYDTIVRNLNVPNLM